MIRRITNFLVRPDFRDYDWLNLGFYSAVLCLGAFLGSFVSVCVIGTAVYSTFHLATGRLKWALPKPVVLVFSAFCGFFAADLIAGIINPSWISLNEILENLPFLGFAGIYSATFVNRGKLLGTVSKAAAVASVLGAITVAVVFTDQYRPELSAGNPSVLALLGGVLLVLTTDAAFRHTGRVKLLYVAAAICAAFLLVATGSRSVLPTVLLVPLLGLFVYHPLRQALLSSLVLIGLLAGVFAAGMTFSPTFEQRANYTVSDISNILSGDNSGSIGQRVSMYKAGYELYFDKPVFGYGPGNERTEIFRVVVKNGGTPVAYSHAHNAILNAALRAGIVGVLALLAVIMVPFAVVLRAGKDEVGQAGAFILYGLLILYVCSGTAGIFLGHDIHDSLYIVGVCYSLYLVFGRSDDPQSVRSQPADQPGAGRNGPSSHEAHI